MLIGSAQQKLYICEGKPVRNTNCIVCDTHFVCLISCCTKVMIKEKFNLTFFFPYWRKCKEKYLKITAGKK